MKQASSINITLNDFKFVQQETVFLEAYVWALYNMYTRPVSDKLRAFCAEMRTHPSLRVRYVVVAGKERVSESYHMHTDMGQSFLTIDLVQSIKAPHASTTKTHLRSGEIATAFDNFMVKHAASSYKTVNAIVHVDIQTVSYRLRPLLLSLSEHQGVGSIGSDDGCFTLSFEHLVDGADTCIEIKFYKTNIKGKLGE